MATRLGPQQATPAELALHEEISRLKQQLADNRRLTESLKSERYRLQQKLQHAEAKPQVPPPLPPNHPSNHAMTEEVTALTRMVCVFI